MQEMIVNDVNIQVATINGTGSQSANLIIMRSLFNMGIPVSGKNLFPSNIAGLPTWYTVRAHHKGYQANKQAIDIAIAMNPNTVLEDIANLRAGGILIYDTGMKIDGALRPDHINYGVPFAKLVEQCSDDIKLKKKVINMLYVGVLAALLNMDRTAIEASVAKQFKNKTKLVELNMKAIDVGITYGRESLDKRDPFTVQTMDKTKDSILIEGNNAAALGALMGGCTVLAWYPITPSSSVCENLIAYFRKYRVDPATGQNRFADVQAEDEIAALGMVVGAGWAGARSMTATSGPGISLMAELTGYAYFTEIPAVIFDIQRMGPSTGLPTRTSQGDILCTYFLSHGDTQQVVLLPSSMAECYEMAMKSFDYAEQFQTPVFMLSDLDLGMNTWMTKPFQYPTEGFERGKVLDVDALQKLSSFGRYTDVDGDGVPYRTLPGTHEDKAPYFTRGSGHNEKAQYSEKPDDWQYLVDRLSKKFDTIRRHLPQPEVTPARGATTIGLLAYGSTRWAIEEALDYLEEQQLYADYMRVKALPLSTEVTDFLANHERIYVVEQNRDGQMAALLKMHAPQYANRIRSILHYNGTFVDALTVTHSLIAQEKENKLVHV